MSNILPFSDANLTSKDFLLLDTSFILSLSGYDTIIQKQPHSAKVKRECEDLINKVVQSGAMFAISIVTYSELKTIIDRDMFKMNDCNNESDKKNLREKDEKKYIEIIENSANELSDYIRDLKKRKAYYPEVVGEINKSLFNIAIDLQKKYKLHGLNDAEQIAIAIKEGFSHFVTLDKDFDNVTTENLTILVDNETYNKIPCQFND